MDDIIESVDTQERANQLTDDIEKLLEEGGFKLKEWTYSNDNSNRDDTKIPVVPSTATEKVLAVVWDPRQDHFKFTVKSGFCPKRGTTRIQKIITPTDVQRINGNSDVMTKRIILSRVNSIYDPLGLAGPYTVRAKILMRRLWTNETEIDWDDPIPEKYRREWDTFFNDLPDMKEITIK